MHTTDANPERVLKTPEHTFVLPVFRHENTTGMAVAGWVGLQILHSESHLDPPTLLYSDDCMFGIHMNTDDEAVCSISHFTSNPVHTVLVNASREPLIAIEFYKTPRCQAPFAVSFARQRDIDKAMTWQDEHKEFHSIVHLDAVQEQDRQIRHQLDTWMAKIEIGNPYFAKSEAETVSKSPSLNVTIPAGTKFVMQMLIAPSEDVASLCDTEDKREWVGRNFVPMVLPCPRMATLRQNTPGVLTLQHPMSTSQVFTMLESNGFVSVELEKNWSLDVNDNVAPTHGHNGICAQVYIQEAVSTTKEGEFAVRNALSAEFPDRSYLPGEIKTGVQPIATQTYIPLHDILHGLQSQYNGTTDLTIFGPIVQDSWTTQVFYRLACVIPHNPDPVFQQCCRMAKTSLQELISMQSTTQHVPLQTQMQVLREQGALRTKNLTDRVQYAISQEELNLSQEVPCSQPTLSFAQEASSATLPAANLTSQCWLGAFDPGIPTPSNKEFRQSLNLRGVGSELDPTQVHTFIKFVAKHPKAQKYLLYNSLIASLHALRLSEHRTFEDASKDAKSKLDETRVLGSDAQKKAMFQTVLAPALAAAIAENEPYRMDEGLDGMYNFTDVRFNTVVLKTPGPPEYLNQQILKPVASIVPADEMCFTTYPLKTNKFVSDVNSALVGGDCEDVASKMLQLVFLAKCLIKNMDTLKSDLKTVLVSDLFKHIDDKVKPAWLDLTVSFMQSLAMAHEPSLGLVLAAGAQYDDFQHSVMMNMINSDASTQTRKDLNTMIELLKQQVVNGHAVGIASIGQKLMKTDRSDWHKVDTNSLVFLEGTAAVYQLHDMERCYGVNQENKYGLTSVPLQSDLLRGLRACLQWLVHKNFVTTDEKNDIASKLQTENIAVNPVQALSIAEFVIVRAVVAIGGHVILNTAHAPSDKMTAFYRYLINIGDKIISSEDVGTHKIYSEIPALHSAQQQKVSLFKMKSKLTEEEKKVLWARVASTMQDNSPFEAIVADEALPTLMPSTLDAMASADMNTKVILINESEQQLQGATLGSFKDTLDHTIASINERFGGNALLVTAKDYGEKRRGNATGAVQDTSKMYMLHVNQNLIIDKFKH